MAFLPVFNLYFITTMKTTQFKNCHATVVSKPESVGSVEVFYSYTTPQAVRIYWKRYILENVRGSRTTSKQLTMFFWMNEKERRKNDNFVYVKAEDERVAGILEQMMPERYY